MKGMALLPTGVAGVVYRPRFIHPVVFNASFRSAAQTNDDLTFRFATLLTRTPVFVSQRSNRLGDNGEISGANLQQINNREGGKANTRMMRQTAQWLHDAGLGRQLRAALDCDERGSTQHLNAMEGSQSR